MAVPHEQDSDEIMISGESTDQPSPPPPGSHLITAQVKGSTLTRDQYNNLCRLVGSLVFVPLSSLVYDGYVINPLTIYWHSYTASEIYTSYFLCAEMAREGIKNVYVDQLCIFDPPQENVSVKM